MQKSSGNAATTRLNPLTPMAQAIPMPSLDPGIAHRSKPHSRLAVGFPAVRGRSDLLLKMSVATTRGTVLNARCLGSLPSARRPWTTGFPSWLASNSILILGRREKRSTVFASPKDFNPAERDTRYAGLCPYAVIDVTRTTPETRVAVQ